MGPRHELLVAVSVLFAALLVRWFAVGICAERIRGWVNGNWDHDVDIPSFARMFRELGWQLSNAAWGLAISAWILPNSHLREVCTSMQPLGLDLVIPSVCM